MPVCGFGLGVVGADSGVFGANRRSQFGRGKLCGLACAVTVDRVTDPAHDAGDQEPLHDIEVLLQPLASCSGVAHAPRASSTISPASRLWCAPARGSFVELRSALACALRANDDVGGSRIGSGAASTARFFFFSGVNADRVRLVDDFVLAGASASSARSYCVPSGSPACPGSPKAILTHRAAQPRALLYYTIPALRLVHAACGRGFLVPCTKYPYLYGNLPHSPASPARLSPACQGFGGGGGSSSESGTRLSASSCTVLSAKTTKRPRRPARAPTLFGSSSYTTTGSGPGGMCKRRACAASRLGSRGEVAGRPSRAAAARISTRLAAGPAAPQGARRRAPLARCPRMEWSA